MTKVSLLVLMTLATGCVHHTNRQFGRRTLVQQNLEPEKAATEEPSNSSVYVHIDAGTTKVQLFRVLDRSSSELATWSSSGRIGYGIASGTSFKSECVAPCGKRFLPAADEFFLGGPEMPNSSVFTLTGAEAVNIKVRPGSDAAIGVGYLFTTLGAIGLGTGIGFAVVSGIYPGQDYGTVTGLSIGGGAALIVLGVVCLAVGSTSYKLEKMAPPASSPENDMSRPQPRRYQGPTSPIPILEI